ncbi:hypothetical protein [uncultured Streptococcus sp.]
MLNLQFAETMELTEAELETVSLWRNGISSIETWWNGRSMAKLL